MANYVFNPADHAVGTNLTAIGWTKRHAITADTWAIQEPSAGLKVLRFTQAVNSLARASISWDAIDADEGRADVEMLSVFRAPNANSYDVDVLVMARGSGLAGNETLAYAGFQVDTQLERAIGEWSAGAITTITSGAISGQPDYRTSGTWLAQRSRINGPTASIKYWLPANPDDPTADEPTEWIYTTSALTVSAAGWVGIHRYVSGSSEIKRLAIATGGDTATFSTTSTPVSFSGPIGNQTGTEGEAFSFNPSTLFAGNETPFAYSVQAGTLPAGLSLNSSTGVISGTPTTAGVSSGLVIRATDAMLNTADSNAFSITIGAAVVVTPPSFTGPSVGSITVPFGTLETLDLSARWSGDLPQTFTAIGAWPSGATVSSDGILQISDIVAVGAYSDLVVRATNSAGFADSNAFTLTIEAITYAASFQTDVMYSMSGMVQANKAVSWTWVPGGRIGDLAGRDVFDGVGTTTAEGRYLLDEIPEGNGLALVTILGETRQDDQVYLEYGAATEEGG